MLKNDPLVSDSTALSLRGRDLLSIHDLSTEQVMKIFEVARALKSETKSGIPHRVLEGKSLGMIFKKSSTRTRISFEVGMWQLGGHALFLSTEDLQMGRGESVSDTAEVMSRYLDGIMIRTYSHQEVQELASVASIPVINGLTDLLHPCQALADYFTAYEVKGDLSGLKLAFIGDGNNVANSLLLGGAKLGVDVYVACPEGYEPPQSILELARKDARATGARIEVVRDPREAASGADIIYTDVWVSMGQELEKVKRERSFAGYKVDSELMSMAAPDSIVMHCLPAHRGEEITAEVIEGPHSVIFDEAENRLHVQKAIMALLMG